MVAGWIEQDKSGYDRSCRAREGYALSRENAAPQPRRSGRVLPYTEHERAIVASYRGLQVVGTPEAVREWIDSLVAETNADEVMVTTVVHGHEARMRSFELLAETAPR